MSATERRDDDGQPSVLAIHAHPDDVEIQCAGTLALLARAGWRVTIATMTPGDCGSAELEADEIAAKRRSESRSAAALIGAAYVCLEFRDLAIFEDDASRRRVTEAIRRARADVVLTAPPEDYLCDHEITSRLVRDACFAAPIPNYATQQWEPAGVLARIPHLYFVDALEGHDREGRAHAVDFRVDVSEVFEVKRAMLACHASQRDWLLKQHGIDEYLDSMEAWSRVRGKELGVLHAEGFRQYRGHAYPQSNRLLEAVGEAKRLHAE